MVENVYVVSYHQRSEACRHKEDSDFSASTCHFSVATVCRDLDSAIEWLKARGKIVILDNYGDSRPRGYRATIAEGLQAKPCEDAITVDSVGEVAEALYQQVKTGLDKVAQLTYRQFKIEPFKL